MEQIISQIIENLENLIISSPPYIGVFIGMFVIVLESMIPILPLAVFIALNMILFGNVMGFIMSWLATIIGCIIMFTVARKYFSNFFDRKTKNTKKVKHLMGIINNMDFSTLVIIIALPFTPAFVINIAAGLSKMSYKKFVLSILISKVAVVYFWGYVGTTFIESITDIGVIIKLGIIMGAAYIISKVIMKKSKID
jgi:uncharacterized membrane protein YdjX (TVP38/TMEM64 family)